MKQVVYTALFLVGMGLSAQQKTSHRPDLTPDQRAEILSKRITLQLDLTDSQQEEFRKLLTETLTEREALRSAPPAEHPEDRFNRLSGNLDRRIAFKRSVRKILNEEQYRQWASREGARPMKSRHRQVRHRH